MPSFAQRLARLQTRRAGAFALVALLFAAAAVPFVARLGLDSAWTALLPAHRPSVTDLERLEGRVGALSTLTVQVSSPSGDREALRAFAADLAPRLEALPGVAAVDWTVRAHADFVEAHRYLYADEGDLEALDAALARRLEEERARANPFYVDLGFEDDAAPDLDATIARLEAHAEEGRERLARFPGGLYLHPDGKSLALFVRSDLGGGDALGGGALMRATRQAAAEIDPTSYGPDLSVELGGDVAVGRDEHQAIARELVTATVVTIALVLPVVFLFFGRLRAIPLLGLALAPPVLLTFAVAQQTVGALNTSTAFLASIVIGNGVNPNVIWLARHFELRRQGAGLEEAIAGAHARTWVATLTASAAAGLAYASLVVTEFRGFHDFGVIGGVGMALCWLGAVLLLPALVALLERLRPLRVRKMRLRLAYGDVFVRALRRPKAVLALAALATAVSLVAVGQAAAEGPFEQDFRNLKSERDGLTEARRVNRRVGQTVGSSAQGNGIVVGASSLAEARRLEAELEAERGPLWASVHSLSDLLPEDQQAKLPLLRSIRAKLLELRPHADDALRARIDRHLPPGALRELHLGDLPEPVARPYTERDGTRGRLLLVEEAEAESIWDGRYLVAWAGALRELRLDDGTPPPLAGRAPIFADVLEAVTDDGPLAVGLSLLMTALLCLFAFRRNGDRAATLGALLLGVLWMAGAMALAGMKLHFLNFVAFPITFGNGVDYAVNVMRRYRADADAGLADPLGAAVGQSGGAVALCSLTTIIGYGSLYLSDNQAIASFGTAMGISEITCLLAALLAVPAMLRMRKGRAPRAAASLA
ncbi:MAG TPA: MMPL family transporter [Polyangiaceae bacterium LLY-WYZ-15_(1-7)]|nr:MMPL family transporter [Polyangiaceae bacterium LLY-WYZ-15_(1-7)]